jgi:hypothetical protein
LINFTHNFTSSTKLDLSKVHITVTSTSIVVNFSGQLNESKTLYLTDNSFISLCVKDAEMGDVSEISSACTGSNETDLTTCLGVSTGTTVNNITCYDLGSRIMIENLSYSGIKGSVAVASSSSGGSGGGGGSGSSGGVESGATLQEWECEPEFICTEWTDCRSDSTIKRICRRVDTCEGDYEKPNEIRYCLYEKDEEEQFAPETVEEEITEPIKEEGKSSSLNSMFLIVKNKTVNYWNSLLNVNLKYKIIALGIISLVLIGVIINGIRLNKEESILKKYIRTHQRRHLVGKSIFIILLIILGLGVYFSYQSGFLAPNPAASTLTTTLKESLSPVKNANYKPIIAGLVMITLFAWFKLEEMKKNIL